MKHAIVHTGASMLAAFAALFVLAFAGACALFAPAKSPDASIADLELACVQTSASRAEADACRMYVRRAWLSVQGITEVTHDEAGGATVEPPAQLDAGPAPVFFDDPTPLDAGGAQ